MRRSRFVAFSSLAAFFSVAVLELNVSRTTTVDVGDGSSVRVTRAAGDGLDGLARTGLALQSNVALAACSSFDVRDTCCPAGCAARNGPNWPRADDIFRGCMRGMGCSEGDAKNATVFMKCECPPR
jgi:hypothetical protein